jgi:CubicO group peptidase (beta-lactamase class C family)
MKNFLLYFNLLLIPINSIAADRYDAITNTLYINEVLVPNVVYKNVSINVDRVVSVKGGPPQGELDVYLPDKNELFIPSVSVGDLIYTNVTIVVGPILSVGKFENTTIEVIPQTDRGGKAVIYNQPFSELPNSVKPNDATISLYEDRRFELIERRRSQDRLFKITPKGNAQPFKQETILTSNALKNELAYGYLLSYLYYDNGIIKYDGKALDSRFTKDVNNETLFATHSTGKSINSYIVAHAICDGHISSIDEIIDWPLMSKTLYQGQSLRNLLNMNAGDKHTVDAASTRVMGSTIHHRDLGLDTLAALLDGTTRIGNELFYNNFLADVIANYIVFKAGDSYEALMRKIFLDKIKIQNEVTYEQHKKTETNGTFSNYYGQAQTLASYSYYITRMDLLRVAEAIMKDYQNQTCVGQYLKSSQSQALTWLKYRPTNSNANLYLHNYSKKYGAQFYFDFHEMEGRNIFGTEGYNGQNMLIDMDNSRIVITNSAATAWDQKSLLLNVIKDGKLPK